MRTAPGKKLGYIVVPLFADQDQMDEQFAIQEEGFDDVADVLNAMLDHDEELVDIIRNLRQQKGEGKPFDLKRLRKKLQLTGPFVNLDALMKSISVKIVDRIGSSWDEWFGLLMKFMAREGHCNVPAKHAKGLSHWDNGSLISARISNTYPTSVDGGSIILDLFGSCTTLGGKKDMRH